MESALSDTGNSGHDWQTQGARPEEPVEASVPAQDTPRDIPPMPSYDPTLEVIDAETVEPDEPDADETEAAASDTARARDGGARAGGTDAGAGTDGEQPSARERVTAAAVAAARGAQSPYDFLLGGAAAPAAGAAQDAYRAEVFGSVPPSYAPEPAGLPGWNPDLPHLSVPDVELDGADQDGLVLRGASLRGDWHRHQAEPRQDAMRLARIGSGQDALLLLAVADGVGSATHSHVGAHLACNAVLDEISEQHRDILHALRVGPAEEARLLEHIEDAVRKTAKTLSQLAHQSGLDAHDCATTLRGTLVPVDPEVPRRVLFSVGCGGFVRLRDGNWEPLEVSEQDGGEGVDVRNEALPDGWRELRVLVDECAPGDLLITCTDGLSDVLPTEGVAEYLATQWGDGAPGLTEFLHQLQLRVRAYDDDRTAVCLWERR